jgi:hypothetical protein
MVRQASGIDCALGAPQHDGARDSVERDDPYVYECFFDELWCIGIKIAMRA